jgi:hypothetical protein
VEGASNGWSHLPLCRAPLPGFWRPPKAFAACGQNKPWQGSRGLYPTSLIPLAAPYLSPLLWSCHSRAETWSLATVSASDKRCQRAGGRNWSCRLGNRSHGYSFSQLSIQSPESYSGKMPTYVPVFSAPRTNMK